MIVLAALPLLGEVLAELPLAAPVAVVPYWSYWVVPVVTITVGAVQTIWLAKLSNKAEVGIVKSVEIQQTQDALVKSSNQTAVSVEKAHLAINSERKVMQDELRALHAANVELSDRIARLLQRQEDRATSIIDQAAKRPAPPRTAAATGADSASEGGVIKSDIGDLVVTRADLKKEEK